MRSVKNNAAALLLLLLALCCPLTAAAQSVEERVNAILINENYISGIGEGETEQEAYQAALQDLAATVSDFRLQRGKTPVSVGDVQIHAQSLNDDVRHMMLLYLTVEKALAITPRHDSAPEAQSPIPAPSPVPAPSLAPAVSQPVTPAPASPTSSTSSLPAAEIAELLAAYCPLQLDELGRILNHNKGLGKVADFGQAGSDRSVPDGAFVVIVGRDYGVKAILSPRNSSPRVNYVTGAQDNETNYHDYGIIWFK